jgi:hypothetical protein
MAGNNGTAIAYFAYARPEHTALSLTSLEANSRAHEFPLFIFADAALDETTRERVDATRTILAQASGFESVSTCYRERNFGCADNIIDGITRVLDDYERVIVVEDDLLLSPFFLDFMVRALDVYRDRADIFSVSAGSPPARGMPLPNDYLHDVYLAPRTSPWGWGTWRDRWQQVDWSMPDYSKFRLNPIWRMRLAKGGNDLGVMLDEQMAGRIDAWNVRLNYTQIMAGKYSLYPRFSYVRNAGLDGSGTHCRRSDTYEVDLDRALSAPDLPADLAPVDAILRSVKRHHDEHWLSSLVGWIPGVRGAVRVAKNRLHIDYPIVKRGSRS